MIASDDYPEKGAIKQLAMNVTYPSNRNTVQILGIMLLHLVLWPLFSLALGWPVQLLWNWLMPVIFGLPTISF